MRIVKDGNVHVSAPFGMPKAEVVRFVKEHRDWIVKARKKIDEGQKRRAAFYDQLPLQTKAQADEVMSRLKALVEPLVEKHATIMGVKPSVIRYKPMISRWGVCNVKNKSICFSAYLLLLPEWCVEHVVVHELCHLLEPNHSVRFYELMDKFFPRWKEARKELQKIYRPDSFIVREFSLLCAQIDDALLNREDYSVSRLQALADRNEQIARELLEGTT